MTDTHNHPVTSTAHVKTDRPGRYAKQLSSHMGRKVPASWNEEAGAGTISFADGDALAVLTDRGDSLDLELTAPADLIERFEDVLGRHLVRFGSREELVCTWARSDDSTGTEQRSSDYADD